MNTEQNKMRWSAYSCVVSSVALSRPLMNPCKSWNFARHALIFVDNIEPLVSYAAQSKPRAEKFR